MSSNGARQASLILDDGTVYKGKLFGASECVAGEVGKFIKLFLGLYVSKVSERTNADDGLYTAFVNMVLLLRNTNTIQTIRINSH